MLTYYLCILVNLSDMLPSDCKLLAAGGTPIEVLGHCVLPLQVENSFSIETDFIISPGIKEPMLGIDWLTRNAAKWNFVEGTIMIRAPDSSGEAFHTSHAGIGKELYVRSVYTARTDWVELASSHVVLPHFACAISKEVLFCVLNRIFNTAKTNYTVRFMTIL